MQLARVLGSVVATVKHPSLEGVRLLLIQPQDDEGTPDGDPIVAADALQAGAGELVEWVTGREAALTLPVTYSPVDAAIITIVDDVNADRRHMASTHGRVTRRSDGPTGGAS